MKTLFNPMMVYNKIEYSNKYRYLSKNQFDVAVLLDTVPK